NLGLPQPAERSKVCLDCHALNVSESQQAGTVELTDGDPENNFLSRALTFNPDGALTGATNLTIAGNYAYVVADGGLVIVDFSTPLEPQIVATVPEISKGTGVAVQFRYAFVTDAAGLAVVDITDPRRPKLAARLPVEDARNLYVARTYAWIAAGQNGIAIVDVERPDRPRLERMYDADGRLDDVYDVKVGSTNASLFAYVANGSHGLEVLQLTSPATTPGFAGFSPATEPRLIAHRHVKGVARAISKGLDRDRAADESGNQVAIFNRLGARPMNLEEMQRLYLRNGALFTVNPGPDTPPLPLGESIRATKENSR
ncbi:MAG: LVIVD repeat-containing protein, partial [Thermoanaerobaculia bacterium]